MSNRNAHEFMECEGTRNAALASLADDIRLAAGCVAPVLISGPPATSREIACAIDRRSAAPVGKVAVINCLLPTAAGAIQRVAAWRRNGVPGHGIATVLLQEVHGLSRQTQAVLEQEVAALRACEPPARLRLIASSSGPLFQHVRHRTFSEGLYYLLNVIHIVVRTDDRARDPLLGTPIATWADNPRIPGAMRQEGTWNASTARPTADGR